MSNFYINFKFCVIRVKTRIQCSQIRMDSTPAYRRQVSGNEKYYIRTSILKSLRTSPRVKQSNELLLEIASFPVCRAESLAITYFLAFAELLELRCFKFND